jgi:hypothetical protein
MRWTRSMHSWVEKLFKLSSENLKGRCKFEDAGAHGRIVLNCISEKWNEKCDWLHLSAEGVQEWWAWVFHKRREFPEQFRILFSNYTQHEDNSIFTFMEHGYLWEANSFSTVKKSLVLWKTKLDMFTRNRHLTQCTASSIHFIQSISVFLTTLTLHDHLQLFLRRFHLLSFPINILDTVFISMRAACSAQLIIDSIILILVHEEYCDVSSCNSLHLSAISFVLGQNILLSTLT